MVAYYTGVDAVPFLVGVDGSIGRGIPQEGMSSWLTKTVPVSLAKLKVRANKLHESYKKNVARLDRAAERSRSRYEKILARTEGAMKQVRNYSDEKRQDVIARLNQTNTEVVGLPGSGWSIDTAFTVMPKLLLAVFKILACSSQI